ncbi:MAG: AI-2E family transporter [Planctomyces sp.]
MSKLSSCFALLAVTLAAAFLFFQLLAVFLLPLFLAVVLVVLLQPVYQRLLRLLNGRNHLAAAAMTFAVLLTALIPAGLLLSLATHEAARVVDQLRDGRVRAQVDQARTAAGLDLPFAEHWRFLQSSFDLLNTDARSGALAVGHGKALAKMMQVAEELHERVAERPQQALPDADALLSALNSASQAEPGTLKYQQELHNAVVQFQQYRSAVLGRPVRQLLRELANPTQEDLRHWSGRAALASVEWVALIGGATGPVLVQAVFGLLIFSFALFFWFADGPQIVRSLMRLSPLEEKYVSELIRDFEVLVRAVVAGSLASALVQTLLAGFGYWLAGLDSVFLLVGATLLMSMVPFVGAAVIWIPAGLWLILGEGRLGSGMFLLAWGALVVSTIDNLIRPWVLLEHASLHPLAALIGVVGGAQALGPIGIFVGPLVVAFAQTLLQLLYRELAEMDATKKTAAAAGAAPLPPQGPTS